MLKIRALNLFVKIFGRKNIEMPQKNSAQVAQIQFGLPVGIP